ncbi:DUF623 domain containing protein [Musa troglodytarum]|uniref:Transcription repressor n=1 Tax=Musa troglodytarum TaxID=320322 RepID=A0A9E7JTB3_9LILI|nr:DUF623 domain containing protein [Musa troglodytarum]
MGNYRFRLSDLMSSSWFYKLKDVGRSNRSRRVQHSVKRFQSSASATASATSLPPFQPPEEHDYLPNRASYYTPSKERAEKLPRSPVNPKASDTRFPGEPPRKSKRQSRRRTATKPCADVVSSAVSASCGCRRTAAPVSLPIYGDECDPCEPTNPSGYDPRNADMDLVVSELKLPPILTKPVKKEVREPALHETGAFTDHSKAATRRSVSGIRGIKVRQVSPRVGSRKVQACRKPKVATTQQKRRPLSQSLVMIKSSSNPSRDFTESMVEMIVENNIREARDLEELLACYLSLNSKEYHEVIIEVFEHIWFVLTDIRM